MLIITLYYILARKTYHRQSILIRPIIWLKEVHFVNLACFINLHYVNCTNQIFFTITIRDVTKKRYIKLMIKNLMIILKDFT